MKAFLVALRSRREASGVEGLSTRKMKDGIRETITKVEERQVSFFSCMGIICHFAFEKGCGWFSKSRLHTTYYL